MTKFKILKTEQEYTTKSGEVKYKPRYDVVDENEKNEFDPFVYDSFNKKSEALEWINTSEIGSLG